MKFKVGDRVTQRKDGDIGIITDLFSKVIKYQPIEVKYEKYGFVYYNENELELVQPKQFTKDDLKERYIVKFRNGEEAMYDGEEFANIKNGNFVTNGWVSTKIDGFNNNLTRNTGDKDYDIVSIYKPKYETIWTREEEEIKEMTVAEIEKELGYAVKVVK